ncbi:hypothetical protein B0T17DRAFT_520776 [Bombardia bombarda]|uniref:Uncharacterized protein n=1 Tax=Bombardia bombarda TaxID=252184 RepID=A0AA39XN85_9PEZI|nr:hypothetical protein B0T17DRAFT_520776 [Bombardia bombarda]
MENFGNTKSRPFPWARGVFLLHVVLFSTAILLNLWASRRLSSSCVDTTIGIRPNSQHHRDPVGHYPLNDVAEYTPLKFDAELGAPSIFKGQPRKELDDAWDALVDQPMIMVNRETLQSFDPTPKPSKKKDGHYYATVEVYHQLHCLDITRKFIWRDHYQHVDTFMDPPEMVWEHVGKCPSALQPLPPVCVLIYEILCPCPKNTTDHCIDLLRQVLMCNSDVGLIFYTDVGDRQPVARVSTTHMCRNFSQITSWVNEHDSELGIFAESM